MTKNLTPAVVHPAKVNLPRAIFLYGLAGSGKSYCGELFAARFGYRSYDLDQHITDAMRMAIREGRSFTDEIRDEFFHRLRDVLGALLKSEPKLIVMQGAYKERHRKLIEGAYPEIEFVRVTAPLEVISRRLSRRGDSVGSDYAASIARNFEPSLSDHEFSNDGAGDDELCARFAALFEGPRGPG